MHSRLRSASLGFYGLFRPEDFNDSVRHDLLRVKGYASLKSWREGRLRFMMVLRQPVRCKRCPLMMYGRPEAQGLYPLQEFERMFY